MTVGTQPDWASHSVLRESDGWASGDLPVVTLYSILSQGSCKAGLPRATSRLCSPTASAKASHGPEARAAGPEEGSGGPQALGDSPCRAAYQTLGRPEGKSVWGREKEGDLLPLLKGQPWKMSHGELSCLSFLPPAWKRKG